MADPIPPTVADHLRQWVAAARGALEWHIETGDVDLPVPDDFRTPPLGRIAVEAPGDGGARSTHSPAQPQSPRAEHPGRAAPGGFARLAEAAGHILPEKARSRPPEAPAPHAPAPHRVQPDGPQAAPEGPQAHTGGFAERLGASQPPDDAPAGEPTLESPPLPPIAADGPAAAAAGLRILRDEIGACTRCPLSGGRTELVFGAGHPRARVMFVADQPGPDDDQVGLPFVDSAGKLLGRMVRAMGLDRSQVYLTHLVKCHDPEQGPEVGLEACGGFLGRQIERVQPAVIIALGGVAARELTGVREQLPLLRGRWHSHRGIPVLATFHPNALAQHPESKREVWEDLKTAMRKLNLPLPARRR